MAGNIYTGGNPGFDEKTGKMREKVTPMPKVLPGTGIAGPIAGTPMPRSHGGIVGPGGKAVNKVYKTY